jgi:peptide/nickel transport system substrate-binding protein
MSTDPVRVSDPAAMTDPASSMLALNVFQRLMTANPGESALKPDLARDCLFTSATTYTCTLNPKVTFHNEHLLTSSDVKFSIERAARLNVSGSSASLLSSLRRIEAPDDITVRFLLSRPDTQFGWALASPAASIVDEEVYDADQIKGVDVAPVGSGPYAVTRFEPTRLELVRFEDYVGRTGPSLSSVLYQTAPDSASIEDAMNKGVVDVVWRGLNAAAVTRYTQQVGQSPDDVTANGYSQQVLTGKRVLQLAWSPQSPNRSNKPLRQAIATALQGDRTLESVIPAGVPGQAPTFPLGGRAVPKVTWKNRINLTLGYDSSTPNGLDLATQIRTRLENTGGLSVRLRPDDGASDLQLLDRKAWTATGLAWLQPYIDAPLKASAPGVEAAETAYRQATDDAQADRLLLALQKQAAVDQVLLPISQSDEYLYTRAGVTVSATSYGPGWQLGLFGMRNG